MGAERHVVGLIAAGDHDAELSEPRSYDAADRDVIRPLLNLVALATARAPAIIELAVTVPTEALAETSRSGGAREIEVLASWLVHTGSDARSLLPDDLISSESRPLHLARATRGLQLRWNQLPHRHTELPREVDKRRNSGQDLAKLDRAYMSSREVRGAELGL